MSVDNKKIDVIEEIASFTGLKLDIVKLVLDAYELVILDKILESQLSDDDTDFVEFGFLELDNSNYPNIVLRENKELQEKIQTTVHSGRDYLSESIILQFNQELLERYKQGDSDYILDGDPIIFKGEDNE